MNIPPLREGGLFRDRGAQEPPPANVDSLASELGLTLKKDWAMSDEFFKLGGLWFNRGRWHVLNPNGWIGRFPGIFRAKNVFVEKEKLILRSTDETGDDPCLRRDRNTARYGTAFVASKQKRQYGYFETRCKLMRSTVTSAFWFANNRDYEIDVFEYSASGKQLPHGVPFSHLLTLNTHVFTGEKKKNDRANPLQIDFGRDISNEIVKIGLLWTEQLVVWYVNDIEVRRVENRDFHVPLRLQLDSELIPNWTGLPEPHERFPNSFDVMYVRSWKVIGKKK